MSNYDPTFPFSIDDHILYYGISEGKYELQNDTFFFTDSDTQNNLTNKF